MEPTKDSRVQFHTRTLAELDPQMSEMARIQATSGRRLSEAVYDLLSEAIRSIRLPPGTPLSELAVAEWLKVSRSPVREAFKRLVDLGLVTVIPQVGSQVAPVSIRDVEEAIFIRGALETSAVQRAIRQPNLDLTELEKILAENRAAFESADVEAFFETDEHLHEQVFVLAGLPRLWEVVRGTKFQLDRLRRLYLQVSLTDRAVMCDHEEIVEAIRQRDEVKGVQVVHQHANRILDVSQELREISPGFFAS